MWRSNVEFQRYTPEHGKKIRVHGKVGVYETSGQYQIYCDIVIPLDTVGSLHAGTKANIIPTEADLRLSVRSFEEPVRQRLLAGIRRIVRAEAAASGATREPEITSTASVPVLVNDPDTTERVVGAIERKLGTAQLTPAITGSEDFSVFGSAAGVPSCFWFVGGADPERYAVAEAAGRLDQDMPSNHSPRYAPVLEPTVTTGVRTLVAAALAWLGPSA